MTAESSGRSSAIIPASILGALWIGIIDGTARVLPEDAVMPGIPHVLTLMGTALLSGMAAGLILALFFTAACMRGPARSFSSGAIAALSKAPWWVVLLSLSAFVLPVAAAVPLRAYVIKRSAYGTAAIDVTALAAGWAGALLIIRFLSGKNGRRLTRRLAGWTLTGIAVLSGLALMPLRPALDPADVWDLVLIGDFLLLVPGIILLLPSGAWITKIACACIIASAAGGAASLYILNADEEIRGETGTDWRPANWVIRLCVTLIDMDGDGYSPYFGGGDCDDTRYDVNPGGIEIAGNGIDENCRGGDSLPELPWKPRPGFVELPDSVQEPRSIVVIVIDAMRPDRMSVYGHNRPTTPRMAGLAGQGVLFTNAYSSAPTTRIAMPVLHTGRFLGEIPWDRTTYPYRMRENTPTVARILKNEKGFRTVAFVTHRFLTRRWGWVQGFEEVDTEFVLPKSDYESASTGADMAVKAASWIEKHADERFYMWIHFLDPHYKYIRHEEADFGDKAIDRFDSEIWYSDQATGVILDSLEKAGIADSTMVVIMSDHGEHFGEHGRTSHGGSLYQEVSRIPLIIKSPGLKPATSECITGHVDLAPTILNFAGIDGSAHGMSGASLVPDMTGTPCDPDREIVLEMRYGRLNASNLRALVGSRYKLIEDIKYGTYRLYDLRLDPGESQNMSGMRPDLYRAMKSRLRTWTEIYANAEFASIIRDLTFDALPERAEAVGAEFENGIELVGVNFGDRFVSYDYSPDLQLYLRTRKIIREDCELRFYLVDGNGKTRFISAHPPVNGTFPVRRWPPDRVVNDGFALELRRKQMKNGKLTPGDYEAMLGIRCDNRKIKASAGDRDKEGRVRLGKIRVEKKGRGKNQ